MCNLKIANCNEKPMQPPGCLRKTIWLPPEPSALLEPPSLVFRSANYLSDAMRGGMAGLNNQFGLYFHNGVFFLNQSPKIIPIYMPEAVCPNPDNIRTHSITSKLLIAEL